MVSKNKHKTFKTHCLYPTLCLTIFQLREIKLKQNKFPCIYCSIDLSDMLIGWSCEHYFKIYLYSNPSYELWNCSKIEKSVILDPCVTAGLQFHHHHHCTQLIPIFFSEKAVSKICESHDTGHRSKPSLIWEKRGKGWCHLLAFWNPFEGIQTRYLSALGFWNIEFEKSSLMN